MYIIKSETNRMWKLESKKALKAFNRVNSVITCNINRGFIKSRTLGTLKIKEIK